MRVKLVTMLTGRLAYLGLVVSIIHTVGHASLERMFFGVEVPLPERSTTAALGGGDQEATVDCPEARHRNQVSGSLMGLRWRGSSEPERKLARKPPLKASATAAHYVEREALNPWKHRHRGTARFVWNWKSRRQIPRPNDPSLSTQLLHLGPQRGLRRHADMPTGNLPVLKDLQRRNRGDTV